MADGEPKPEAVALLGAGVIGGGWAARMLLNGVDVRLFDPARGARQAVPEVLERARRAWRKLTLAPLPAEGTLTCVDSVAEAVAGATLVQESAPERERLKRALLAEASAAAPEDAIFASSTSGLLPSRLCADMDRPERLVVGHPFNPVYLLPLVEVCGGERTAPETVARAAAIYRAIGMHPLIVRREIDGFLSDRLLEALWREALWLVADDVATVEEVDDAIRYGPGLRWSAMGTFLTYRLAGGEAGMHHFMAQFGPTLKLPWSRLTDVPELDLPLLSKLVEQSDAQAAGRSIEQLVRIRDDCLVAVLKGLKGAGFAAGEVIARTERRLLQAAPDSEHSPRTTGPLRLHEAIVIPEWIDYNGHMTEYRYLEVLADGTDALLRHIGIDAAYLEGGHSYYTVETHLRHLDEAHGGDRIYVSTQLLGHDEKRLHLFHELRREDEHETLLATSEHMLLHIDTNAGATAPARPTVLDALRRLAEDQAGLGWPEAAGGRCDINPRGLNKFIKFEG